MKKIILLILLVLFIFSPLFGEDHVPYYLDQIENKFVEPTLTTIDKRRETYYVLINSSDNADVLLMAKNYYELLGKMNDSFITFRKTLKQNKKNYNTLNQEEKNYINKILINSLKRINDKKKLIPATENEGLLSLIDEIDIKIKSFKLNGIAGKENIALGLSIVSNICLFFVLNEIFIYDQKEFSEPLTKNKKQPTQADALKLLYRMKENSIKSMDYYIEFLEMYNVIFLKFESLKQINEASK